MKANYYDNDISFECDRCKIVGFCQKANPEKFDAELEQIKKNSFMSDEEIKNLVYFPYQITHRYLEVAHKAFQENDLETAMLNYLAFLEKPQKLSHNDFWMRQELRETNNKRCYQYANMGLSVINYINGNFNEAINFASKVGTGEIIYTYIFHINNLKLKINKSGDEKTESLLDIASR